MKRTYQPEYDASSFGQAADAAGTITAAELPDLFAEVMEIIREGIADNFAKQATSEGIPWPARKRPGDGHPLLHESGALEAAATGVGAGTVERQEGEELVLGVEKIDLGGLMGARVHQEGYPERNIPQREYLAMSDATIQRTVEAAADHLVAAMF